MTAGVTSVAEDMTRGGIARQFDFKIFDSGLVPYLSRV